MASQSTEDMGRGNHLRAQSTGLLLTVSEVARLLRVHPNSVRRWADMGLLAGYRIGHRGDRRFDSEEIHEFLGSWRKHR